MYKLFSFLLMLCCASFAKAQYSSHDNYLGSDVSVQLGVSGGIMNCITDLGGKRQVAKNAKPEGGFYIGLLYKNRVGARLETTWGSVMASDVNARQVGTRQRNLSFASDISEISLLAEVHPVDFYNQFHVPLSIYVLGGIGSFSFNPTTQLNGQTIMLQPLHTEGEGFPETGRPNYKLTQMMLPVGGGLAYQLSSLLTLKGELVYRFLHTDYLDDVSTNYIDPSLFDKYLSASNAALAKKLYSRSNELSGDHTPPAVGSIRGSSAKDGYYSLNVKLEFTF